MACRISTHRPKRVSCELPDDLHLEVFFQEVPCPIEEASDRRPTADSNATREVHRLKLLAQIRVVAHLTHTRDLHHLAAIAGGDPTARVLGHQALRRIFGGLDTPTFLVEEICGSHVILVSILEFMKPLTALSPVCTNVNHCVPYRLASSRSLSYYLTVPLNLSYREIMADNHLPRPLPYSLRRGYSAGCHCTACLRDRNLSPATPSIPRRPCTSPTTPRVLFVRDDEV
jgi:hypothetical protein